MTRRRAPGFAAVVEATLATMGPAKPEWEPSGNIGAGELGKRCARFLYYVTQKVERPEPGAQAQRIFDTGNALEPLALNWIRRCGFDLIVRTTAGRQGRIDIPEAGVTGRVDGLLRTDAMHGWIVEVKSMNARKFGVLLEDGVREAAWEHWVQMLTYLHRPADIIRSFGLPERFVIEGCLYFAINRDSLDIAIRPVLADEAETVRLVDRAARIRQASAPPARVSSSPRKYPCRYCDFALHCFDDTTGETDSA